MKLYRCIRLIGAISALVFFSSTVFAKPIIDGVDGWKTEGMYRPAPIYFLHGMGEGNVKKWDEARDDLFAEGEGDDKEFYHDMYADMGNRANSYLHAIDFHPSFDEEVDTVDSAMSMIERNSSIDCYAQGDKYVEEGLWYRGDYAQVAPLDPGWTARVNRCIKGEYAVENPGVYDVDRYEAGKAVLVGHSMGGLAGREFLTNPDYADEQSKFKKLITLGTPHTGAAFANAALQFMGEYVQSDSGMMYYFSEKVLTSLLRGFISGVSKVDLVGDAVRDMAIGSEYLTRLRQYDARDAALDYCFIGGTSAGIIVPATVSNIILNGDGVVSMRSQLGYQYNPLDNARVVEVDEEARLTSNHIDLVESACQPYGDAETPLLLQMIEETPRLSMPVWNQYDHYGGVPLYAQLRDVYFPAQCEATVYMRDAEQFGEWVENSIYSGGEIYPDDEWAADDQNSPVAAFWARDNFGSTAQEIKLAVSNVAGETGTQQCVYMPGSDYHLLSKWRERELSFRKYEDEDEWRNDDTIRTALASFWPSISAQPVTVGGAAFSFLENFSSAPDTYCGDIVVGSPYVLATDKPAGMASLSFRHKYSEDPDYIKGDLCGVMSRAYITYSFSALREDLKALIDEHGDAVKMYFGFFNMNVSSGGFVPELIVRKASFSGAGSWDSGSEEICRINGSGDQRFISIDSYGSRATRFAEMELPREWLDTDGVLQMEILLRDEDAMPAIHENKYIGESAGYMNVHYSENSLYKVAGACEPYLKIVLPQEDTNR